MTRKIDKRACRKFAIPELEFNLNEGILHVERCPYIIRTAVHNISGQRILVLYIYQSENILAGSLKPRWVMFHSRDDFATLSFREDAKATWQWLAVYREIHGCLRQDDHKGCSGRAGHREFWRICY